MALPVFPPEIMAPSYGLKEVTRKPRINLDFEGGYTESRPKFTRAKKKFPLEWLVMPEDQYQILEAFFKQYQGAAFLWTHPLTDVVHTVIFDTDELGGQVDGPYHRRVTAPIVEV